MKKQNLDGAVLKIASRGLPTVRTHWQGLGVWLHTTVLLLLFSSLRTERPFPPSKSQRCRFLAQVNGLAMPGVLLHINECFPVYLQFRPSWSAGQPGLRDPGAEGTVLPFTFLFWTVFLRSQGSQTRKREGTQDRGRGSGPTSSTKETLQIQ